MLGMLLQIALVIGAVMLAMRFFRSRQPSTATAGPTNRFGRNAYDEQPSTSRPSRIPTIGSASGQSTARQDPAGNSHGYASAGLAAASDDIGLKQDDLDRVRRATDRSADGLWQGRLRDAAQADHARGHVLSCGRARPECDGWAAQQRLDVKLLQADIAEAWAEGDTQYATTAMRYSSVDTMLDRRHGTCRQWRRREAVADDGGLDLRAQGQFRLEAVSDPGRRLETI